MIRENIQQLFEQAAEKFRTSIAIERGARRVTYQALQERSNNLAHLLIARGMKRGARVGILAEDAIEVITAIIATLKAGGVFVPFEPRTPQKRLEALVSLVSPEWFVTEPSFLNSLEETARRTAVNFKALCVGDDGPIETTGGLVQVESDGGRFNPSNLSIEHEPDEMAYVYFTSGSTGTPKGIAGCLKGIDHFIRWEIETLSVGEGTRVSRFLPFSFDGSLRDIWVPLCAGGVVCIPEESDTLLDARKLVSWIDSQRINIIHCVPSLFRAMVNEQLTADLFPHLKYILMAGEPLLPADVGRWMDAIGERVQLVNLYGTSETTMAKFFYLVKEADRHRRTIPIGKPMEGAKAVLVDDSERPCPAGMVGEIYIRTPYRSLGYYGQPELTARVFIPNPFGLDPQDIVHKTGDFARVLDDGNYEYLGRRDQQVKIRGVRVELEEIENLLRVHEAIRDVAVVDRQDNEENKYLCAYLVLGREIASSDVKDYLSEHLPEHLIPSSFILMETLPRTLTGKIDRRALPAPNRTGATLRPTYVAPITPLEDVMAKIWAKVLDLEKIGLNDDFFQIGGHSLRATQVLSRMRAAFGIEIPLRSLFEKPTIASMAAYIETQLKAGHQTPAAPIKPVSRDRQLPLSFAQQRLWLLDQLEAGTAAYNVPGAVRLTGELNIPALEQALTEVVRRHEILRTAFCTVDTEPVQQVKEAEAFSLSFSDLSHLPPAQHTSLAQSLATHDAQLPFILSQPPLLRARLLRLSPASHILIFTMHHIICDGWSLGILIREVAALYQAYALGRLSPLEELEIQYADYVVWQREWLQGEVLEEQLAYWKEQLGGELPVLEMPTDRPRPAVQSYRGATVRFELGERLSRGLRELSQGEGVTMYMSLLAAFEVLLMRYSGQEEVLVGTPIANRNRDEVEGLIGFFANTMVMRGKLGGNPRFSELLRKTREVCLGAYGHQDLPFEVLVAEIQPERDLSRTPLFHVVFTLQNVPIQFLNLRALTWRFEGVGGTTAKFDIGLNILDQDDKLSGQVEYSTDLFEGETISKMVQHYINLLESIVAQPEARLSELEMLSQEEQALLEQRIEIEELNQSFAL